MGMDVYGIEPTGSNGEYFRRSVWGWRPLWECVQDLQPEIAFLVEYAQTNDGDGLDAEDSARLAELLREDLVSGRVDQYVNERNAKLSALPRLTCGLCEGTGIRTDKVGAEMKMPERELEAEMAILLGRTHGWCNGCGGEGKKDAWETNYHLETDDVHQFIEFLEECGGFEIC